MSSRARLILHSGLDASHVTAVARAAAEAALDEGLRVALVDARTRSLPDDFAADVRAAAAGLGGVLGADPLPSDVWMSLPGVTSLAVLAEATTRLDDPAIDVVIVDAGDVSRTVDLVRAPALALRVTDALLTPSLAMWRPAGGGGPSADSPFTALDTLRVRLAALRDLVESARTTVRLITTSDSVALDRTAGAAATLAMLGVGVDGVVVQRASRKGVDTRKGADKWAVVDEEARVEKLTKAVAPIAVWVAGNKQRPAPKGRSILGPFGGKTARLDAADITVVAGDEDFLLELVLLRPARDSARVGVRAGELVVEFDDAQRWLMLPPILHRCRPVGAVRTAGGLRVRFVPDPDLWPGMLSGEAA